MYKINIVYSLYDEYPVDSLGLRENLEFLKNHPNFNIIVYIREVHHSLVSLKTNFPKVTFVTFPDHSAFDRVRHFEEAMRDDVDLVAFRSCKSRITLDDLIQLTMIVENPDECLMWACGNELTSMWACKPNTHATEVIRTTYELFKKHGLHNAKDFVNTCRSAFLNKCKLINIPKPDLIVPPQYLKYINKYFVLNPDKYKNRLEKLKRSFSASTLLTTAEFIRIRGCTKEEEPIPYWFRPGRNDNPHYWLANQDHKRILKQGLVEQADLWLVFEDDAEIREDFDNRLVDLLSRCDRNEIDWCALMLGGSNWHEQLFNFDYLPNNIKRVRGVYGQHAILYNYTGLHGFYGHCLYHNHENIDVAFAGFQNQDQRVYTDSDWLVDFIGVQNGNDS